MFSHQILHGYGYFYFLFFTITFKIFLSYYSDCAKKKPAKQANDKKAAERLWKMSEELVGLNS